jgi:hypothetical protein
MPRYVDAGCEIREIEDEFYEGGGRRRAKSAVDKELTIGPT